MKLVSLNVLEYRGHEDNTLKKTLSIFLHSENVDENYVDSEIAAVVLNNTIDQIYFVGLKANVEQVAHWLIDDAPVLARLTSVMADLNQSVHTVSFDSASGEHCLVAKSGKNVEPCGMVDDLRQHMLRSIFAQTNGMVHALEGFHYVKPSQKHTDRFLRVSNVLECPRNVYILAFWLMPYIWNKPIAHIVVDTSSIAAVALSLAYEAKQLGGVVTLPIISSHNSYAGVSGVSLKDLSTTLFLISASTSGDLERKLLEIGALPKNVVTLFALAKAPSPTKQIACNVLGKKGDDGSAYDAIENYSKDDCPWCAKQSFAVEILGDQFSLEPPRVQELLIALADLPSAQRDTINDLAGIGVFKVFRRVGDRNYEIFLNTEALFPASIALDAHSKQFLDTLRKHWEVLIRRGIPIHLQRIVHTSYPFSDELSISVEGVLHANNTNTKAVRISGRELRTESTSEHSASLVVSGCIDDSHEFMAINRDLRQIQPRGNTTYISPIFRAITQKERRRIRSNMTHGEYGADTFSLYCLLEIDLPQCAANHSWMQELQDLNRLVEWADENDRMVPDEIGARIKFLQEAPSTGLSDRLFWPSPRNEELNIRPDFTFIDVKGGDRPISQADVYVVIAAVFHNLRLGGAPNKPKLVYKPYERTEISPDSFQRLNDGVIQASMLRAARSFELSYSNCNDSLSRNMRNLIVSQIHKLAFGDGEALMEFLVALLSKRLTLKQADTEAVCNAILSSSELLPDHFLLVAEFLLQHDVPR